MTPQQFDNRLSFALIFVTLCAFAAVSLVERRITYATIAIISLVRLIALYKYIR